MKKILFAIFFAVLFLSCEQLQGNKDTGPVDHIENPPPVVVDYSKDPRLSAFSAASTEWINYPSTAPSTAERAIKKDKDILDKCNKSGWNYMFYDDEAVIGYEPVEGDYSVMLNAVKITIESHNLDHPDKKWDYHTVSPPAPPPPVTSNDPVLGVWQTALCTDDGHIVLGPYTAEFDWNWEGWKGGIMALQCESYNLDHPDNKAHVVWGTEKP